MSCDSCGGAGFVTRKGKSVRCDVPYEHGNNTRKWLADKERIAELETKLTNLRTAAERYMRVYGGASADALRAAIKASR